MKLYLLRHGHSPSAAQAGVVSDAERPLSEEGRQAVARSMRRLLERGGKPALVLHSPLKRAVETAREAARTLGLAQEPRIFPPLANLLPASELYEELKEDSTAKASEVLLVGHQPQLGELAALLCGQVFELKTAGLIALETGKTGAQFLWSANPGDP